MIIDTNVYSNLLIGNDDAAKYVKNAKEILLPIMVIAELQYGFLAGSKNDKNNRVLEKFISQPQVDIILPSYATSLVYAKLAYYCRKKGKALSQNDIWIASLAKEQELSLLTFDKDFAVFTPILKDNLVIL